MLAGVVDDAEFAQYVARHLSGISGGTAVSLGGSRAAGTRRPDSDWDFSVYYRGRFDPGELRELGWPGEIIPVGGRPRSRTCWSAPWPRPMAVYSEFQGK